MDAREATALVKQYFTDINGAYGCVAFQVLGVSRVKGNPSPWIVQCSFFTSVMGGARQHYEVTVDDETNIQKVERLDPPAGG